MSDGMHLAQEQDERANQELHAEIERKTFDALKCAFDAEGMDDEHFALLCWHCGFKVSDFTGKEA